MVLIRKWESEGSDHRRTGRRNWLEYSSLLPVIPFNPLREAFPDEN